MPIFHASTAARRAVLSLAAVALAACSATIATTPNPSSGDGTGTGIPGPTGGTGTAEPGAPSPGQPGGGPGAAPVEPSFKAAKLVAGDHQVIAVTSDDNAVYLDRSDATVKVVSLGGGAPVTLATNAGEIGSDTGVVVSGKVVFLFTQLDFQGIGRLRAWTASSGGAVELAQAASYAHGAAASDDGALAVFVARQAGPEGSTTIQVLGASVSNTPSPKVLASELDGTTECKTVMTFAARRALVSACPEGAKRRALRGFDGAASWGGALLLEGGAAEAAELVLDAARTKVIVLGEINEGDGVVVARVVPVGGGAPVAVAEDVDHAYLSPDGAAVVFQRTDGALFRVSSAGGPKTELLPSGAISGNLLAFSGDFKWALASSQTADHDAGVSEEGNPLTFPARNVYAVSLEATGQRIPLLAETVGAAGWRDTPAGDGFTSDGVRALYFTGIDAAGLGTLTARALATGGAGRALASASTNARALVGGKVAWERHVVENGSTRVALEMADIARGGATETVSTSTVNGARSNPAGTRLVYAAGSDSGEPGLFVADVR